MRSAIIGSILFGWFDVWSSISSKSFLTYVLYRRI